jgi:large subunit ribosomal protein L18
MNKSRADIRRAVHGRIRKKVQGTAERPRLAVFRSLNHIYAQVIDDKSGRTLAAASTVEDELKGKTGGNIEAAQKVGKTVAERALAAGISQVVYDRGGYLYHGRVKALIDATREAGLNKNDAEVKEETREEGNE